MSQNDEMRPEYDIRGGVRGKYHARYQGSRGITFGVGSVVAIRLSTSQSSDAKITTSSPAPPP